MTLPEMRAEMLVWQKKLGIPQWKIRLRHPTKNEMAADLAACCYWVVEYSSAEIIISKKHFHLHSLVHELLHLRLEGHQPHPREYSHSYEAGINSITEALLGKPEPEVK